MNSSMTLSPGNTEGFDEFAGRRWIYPNNLPIRSYQKQAVEKALFHNAMIVLPTGFGKTFIAAVVMYNYFLWYPRGKMIFVAPTKPLVAQQIEECKKICGFPSQDCIEMTGTLSRERRAEHWLSRRVFFATPQCIENDLENLTLPAKDVKLIIIDEAHKATGGYAYVNIVRYLHEHNRNGFRVVALSATPGSNIERVQQVMINLYISEVMFRSEQAIDLMPFKNEKTAHGWTVELVGPHKSILDQFVALTHPYFKELHRSGLTFRDSVDQVSKWMVVKAMKEVMSNLAGEAKNRGRLKFVTAACSSMCHHFEILTMYGLRPFYQGLRKAMEEPRNCLKTLLHGKLEFERMMKQIEDIFGDHIEINPEKMPERDLMISHPKMNCLKGFLTEHFQNSDKAETRAMVFSTYRDSVFDIVQALRSLEPLIKPKAFVGQGKGTSSGMTQKEQIRLVTEFKEGKYNVLVATCVAEEGLDIGEVDLLICYDTKASPISSTQRRGRTGRKRAGVVHTLLTKGYEEKKLKSSSTSRRTVEEQLFKRDNYMSVRYRDAPRMVPAHIHPEFFPQRVEPIPEPEAEPTKPRRKRQKVAKAASPGEKCCDKGKKKLESIYGDLPVEDDEFDDDEDDEWCKAVAVVKRKSILDSSDEEEELPGFLTADKL